MKGIRIAIFWIIVASIIAIVWYHMTSEMSKETEHFRGRRGRRGGRGRRGYRRGYRRGFRRGYWGGGGYYPGGYSYWYPWYYSWWPWGNYPLSGGYYYY